MTSQATKVDGNTVMAKSNILCAWALRKAGALSPAITVADSAVKETWCPLILSALEGLLNRQTSSPQDARPSRQAAAPIDGLLFVDLLSSWKEIGLRSPRDR